jgi:hypothetical protein
MVAAEASWWSSIIDIATLLTGAGATLTAYFSWKISRRALTVQDHHNRLTQRPYPFLALADYEEKLRVKFVNDGSGPFIIKRVRVCRGNECKNDLLAWMEAPPEGIFWKSYTSMFEGRALLPNNEIILLELEGKPSDINFVQFRDQCRERLRHLRVLLEYTDSYGQKYDLYTRDLEWFGRDKGTRKHKKAS